MALMAACRNEVDLQPLLVATRAGACVELIGELHCILHALMAIHFAQVVTSASDYSIHQITKSIFGGPDRNDTKPTAPCKAPYILLGALQGAQKDLIIRSWGYQKRRRILYSKLQRKTQTIRARTISDIGSRNTIRNECPVTTVLAG